MNVKEVIEKKAFPCYIGYGNRVDYQLLNVEENTLTLKTYNGNITKSDVYYYTRYQHITDPKAIEKFEFKIKVNKFTSHFYEKFDSGLSLGSDPEIFVGDKDGKVIPAYTFLPDKKNPYIGGFTTAYWDGFQAEYTTNSVNCLSYFTDYIREGMLNILNQAKIKNKEAKLLINNTVDIEPHLVIEGKEEHVQFGCMPSFNAYGMTGVIGDGRSTFTRSAGGHLHFGFSKAYRNKDTLEKMVKSLDAIVGVACVSLFESLDNPNRRKAYGLAGEYRMPAHGLEYRTLSNAWLCHPLVATLVYELARVVIKYGATDCKGWVATEEEVIHTINNCDVKYARRLLFRNRKLFKALLCCGNMGLSKEEASVIHGIFMKDVTNLVKDPSDLVTNWMLTGGWIHHTENKDKCWKHAKATVLAGKKVA